jgi:hypothetical protein
MIKLFLSHAFEDKDDFVRPLAVALQKSGFGVWFDEYELVPGHSLLEKIDEGLRSCDYGIVVLSQDFFRKKWPRRELDGLFSRETTERNLIIPIWKGVSVDDVHNFSPILAGRLGVSADRGMEVVVNQIKRAVGYEDRYKALQQAAWKEKFASLDANVLHQRQAAALAQTTEGVKQVTEVARKIIAEARLRSEELSKQLKSFELRVSDNRSSSDRTFVEGPRNITMSISFEAGALNSVDHCTFHVYFFRERDYSRDGEQTGLIEQYDFLPKFDRQLKVCWQSSDKILSTGDALLDLVFERFGDLLERELHGLR